MRHGSGSLLSAVILALPLLLAAGGSGEVHARDRRCYGLEDELARLSSLSDDRRAGAQTRRWDRALQEAGERLAMLERRSRRARCGRRGFLFSAPDPRVCEGIERDMADIRARMARLSRNRTRSMQRSDDGETARRIARVRAQIDSLDCHAPDYRAASRPSTPTGPESGARNPRLRAHRPAPDGSVERDPSGARDDGLFGMLFGGGRQRYRGERDYYTPYEDRDHGGGTYRTLCVRRCDGFYFPISFSTTQDQFFQDADQCQAMCPGADAELFVYRNPGEDISAMVSLDGTPYTDLQNAYRYRTEFDAECSCKSKNMSVARAGTAYDGDMTPLSGGGTGREINATGSDPANDWDGTPAWESERVWDPNEPWDMEPEGERWDPDDPWAGYRAPGGRDLVTETRPLPKLPAEEDPDTVLNRRGGYVPKLARAETPETESQAEATQDDTADEPGETRKIRRVGPKYFVAQ